MDKEGQLNLSFSMIFTILIIIVTIAVASYVIVKFLNVNKCQEIGTFYSDLEKEATKALSAGVYSDTFTIKMNSFNGKIKAICFGNLTQTALSKSDDIIKRELNEEAIDPRDNIFIYPTSEACDAKFVSKKIGYIETDGFFCVALSKGTSQFRMSITEDDNRVKVSEI